MAPSTTQPKSKSLTDNIKLIFESCDVNKNGMLKKAEFLYALQAFGFYLQLEDIEEHVEKLNLLLPLNKTDFQTFLEAMETSGCK